MESDLPNLGPRKKFAKTLAARLLKDVAVNKAPVSLQRVIEYLQSTRSIAVQHIPDAGERVSGLLVVCKEVDEEYVTIGFNASHPWYRRRFTIAHEIGHLLLGHTCNSEGGGSHNEREANVFASELLMPTDFIKNDFKKTRNLKELSKLYRVSEQALTIQLMETRII